MESVRRLPAPALRAMVGWYSGWRQAGVAAAVHRGLPSPWLTFIITIDEPLLIVDDVGGRRRRYDMLVGGLHTSPTMVAHDGRQYGIQVGVHPLAARILLGLPAGELTGVDLDADQVFGGACRELRERVATASSWMQRFTVVDQFLLGAARARDTMRGGGSPVAAEVVWAWRRLCDSGGVVAISELAREVGWSPRYLQNRFGLEVGLTPKMAARVVRFHRARRLLAHRVAAGQAPALADLAAGCGYVDQAHLARDFRDLAGCPPSRWLVEQFRNIQAHPGVPDPD